jgi:DNA gyrase subunit A
MTAREGENVEGSDFVEHLFTATTHDILFFTQSGAATSSAFSRFHEGSRQQRRSAKSPRLCNDEKIAANIRIRRTDREKRPGAKSSVDLRFRQIGRSRISMFETGKGGIIAIKIEEEDVSSSAD